MKYVLEKIICIMLGIGFLLPVTIIQIEEVHAESESRGPIYCWREAESFDWSWETNSGKEWIIGSGSSGSNGYWAEQDVEDESGDKLYWDFTVSETDDYYIWIRGFVQRDGLLYEDGCEYVNFYWNDNLIDTADFYHGIQGWKWFKLDDYYPNGLSLSEGSIGTLKLQTASEGFATVDNILITTDGSYNPIDSYKGKQGYTNHTIGKPSTSNFGSGIENIDEDYINRICWNLSNINNEIQWEDFYDIPKGRFFGSAGELQAAQDLKYEFDKLGIHSYKEPVAAYPTKYINDLVQVRSKGFKYKLTPGSQEETIDEFFIGPRYNDTYLKCLSGIGLNLIDWDSLSYNCSHQNLELINKKWDVHSLNNFDVIFEEFIEEYSDQIDSDIETYYTNRDDEEDFNDTFMFVFNLTKKYFEINQSQNGSEIFTFDSYDPMDNTTWPDFLNNTYTPGSNNDYLYIGEDPWNNPDLPRDSFFRSSIFRNIVNRFVYFFFLTKIIMSNNEDSEDHCRGLILYDFNEDCYNMVNTRMMALPLIFINGSVGQDLNESIETVEITDFWVDQYYNDSIESYNVIGTIYGEDPSKTVILCSLYDCWWNNGTTDSAIGTSIVMGIAKYFMDNNIIPKYNLKLIGFSGEESGFIGAKNYAHRHLNEDIIAVIDLNQLGFDERNESVDLDFIVTSNKKAVDTVVDDITQRTNYEDRTGIDFIFDYQRNGAQSNDCQFNTIFHDCDTINFLKDTNWTLHHRSGNNYLEGDVFKYYNSTLIPIIADMVMNVTKYYTDVSISEFELDEGWNQITIPAKNTSYERASTLAGNISYCTELDYWNNTLGYYQTWLPSWSDPEDDFKIRPGTSFFVYISSDSSFRINGNRINSVSVSLGTGWNMIGWYQDESTNASILADSIDGCTELDYWNNDLNMYQTWLPDWSDPEDDFKIKKGMGLFVCVDQPSTWNGDAEGSGRSSSNGSRDGDSNPGFPHPIYGNAYYGDGTTPAAGANVTIINVGTEEEIYGIVQDNSNYIIGLEQFSSGWNHGDTLRILVMGTGAYSAWYDYTEITADNTTPHQQVPDLHIEPVNISLYDGWNLVSMPVDNEWMASDLADNVSGCLSVSKWDQYAQSYWAYFVNGPESFDFELEPGYGYFVETDTSSTITIPGESVFTVNIPLKIYWDLIGWFKCDNISAKDLSENISGCLSVSKWDPVMQSYYAYFVGGPDSFDFPVSQGMGVFVEVDEESTWTGEGSGSGGGRSGSNNSSSLGLPFAVYGRAFYKNQSVPVLNASMTIQNLNTSDSFNSTVPLNYSGWFNEDLNQFNNSNWSNGNILRIFINGTGNYSGWIIQKDVIINDTNSSMNLSDFYCVYPSYPQITNFTISPITGGIGENITISAVVSDSVNEITDVSINLSYPDNSWINTSMSTLGNNSYQYIVNDTWQEGEYPFIIWAQNDINNTNTSNQEAFSIDSTASIQVCTLQNEYRSNKSLNLTDPPGGVHNDIGYELLKDGSVLHVWNRFDSYYFNTSSGIQLTNHLDEYWARNILMLGYYYNDEWNVLYRTDELSGFQKSIETDDTSFLNATLWKDLTYNSYEFRLAIRYHLGVDDHELTIIPYIKNLGESIPYNLGFAWEVNDIQIDMTQEDDYLLINDTSYWLNDTLDLSFTNLSRPIMCWNETLNQSEICGYESIPYYYIREDQSDGVSKSLYLRWNPDVNYKVWITSRNNSYNAPVVLGMKIGPLGSGQSKQTMLYWYDASEITYYFDAYSIYEAWTSNPSYMVNNNTGNAAYTTVDGDSELCNSNSCSSSTDLGTISKVEIRGAGMKTGAYSCSIYFRPLFDKKSGDDHEFSLSTTASWSDWFDITSDTNAPREWSWEDVVSLDCRAITDIPLAFPMPTVYCSKIEFRVTYTSYTPPCISNPSPVNGVTNVSISPTLGITVADDDGDTLSISWLSNCSGSWTSFGSNNSVGNGTYYQTLTGANVNGQWWYWMVNVSDGNTYNESSVFKFYTGTQSKISNTGSSNLSGYLLMQVEYLIGSTWTVDSVVINDSSLRTINASSELGLDTVFNDLITVGELSNGDGDYRVYAALRDADGEVLEVDGEKLEAWWRFEVDLI